MITGLCFNLIICTLYFWLFLIISVQAADNDHYFSTNGEDNPECKYGGIERPWRSLKIQYENGCINAGARIYFKPGIYRSESDVFGGRLNIMGLKQAPIVISVAHGGSADWPVTFLGNFIISNAEYLIIDGIDFARAAGRQPVIAIGASYITIQNSKIHGLEDEFSKYRHSPGDCLKIAGGSKQVTGISIIDNEIYNCAEDAIDITGRSGITIRGNRIHHAWSMQIKGGAKDVVIEDNHISQMRYGITGNGMDCSDSNIYCGSPELPNIPAEKRYECKNIYIFNNWISDIWAGRAIDFSGWHSVQISGNFIFNGNVSGGAIISARNDVGTVFLDDGAKEYCAKQPDLCLVCRMANGAPCWKIRSLSQDVRIIGNYIESDNPLMIKIDYGSVSEPHTICQSGNRYFVRNGAPKFKIGNRLYEESRVFPNCPH